MRFHPWALAALAASVPTPALPCSPSPCLTGHLIPRDDTAVPRDAPGIVLVPERGVGDVAATASVTVTADDGEVLAVRVETGARSSTQILFDTPLREGRTYQVAYGSQCRSTRGEPLTRSFQAGPSAPLPTTLGTLAVTSAGMEMLEIGGGAGCFFTESVAHARVELTPSAEAEPWMNSFFFETRVDGQLWAPVRTIGFQDQATVGASWRGRGKDDVFAVCRSPSNVRGLSEGVHQVELRATIPGGPTLSASVHVALDCAGGAVGDAGVADVGPGDGSAEPTRGGSSGCQQSGPQTSLLALLVVGLCAFGLRRRGPTAAG